MRRVRKRCMSEALLVLTARLAVPVLAVGLLLCVCWLRPRLLATLHSQGSAPRVWFGQQRVRTRHGCQGLS